VRFRQNGIVDSQDGHAAEAGKQMDSELDAIQERLRALKRELDARESVVDLGGDSGKVASSGRESSG
jgi:hypothetical protein